MKTLIVAVVVIAGSVHLGSKAFDVLQAQAQQSQTAALLEARQSL